MINSKTITTAIILCIVIVFIFSGILYTLAIILRDIIKRDVKSTGHYMLVFFVSAAVITLAVNIIACSFML
ncbi:hypothetical protein [Niabella beijingensis]|uniref:hypothetical protein n=1 Tax=Niabella beijingensis TaxID=2872700 RepID=UPI001CBB5F7B|nr:hypothetical protein [Niabella beijingensis]MBZ4192266.1 hypothetical protein [Niabella beijingensis]